MNHNICSKDSINILTRRTRLFFLAIRFFLKAIFQNKLYKYRNYNLRFIKSLISNYYLENVTGVIHVGANVGQSRDLYDFYALNVIWIEPIEKTFKTLEKNIKNYPKQKAYNYLITDKDDKSYDFFITNNNVSSSIFKLSQHKKLFPDVKESYSIRLQSKTLKTLLEEKKININNYQFLNLDTQGSELLILKGASSIINKFSFIKTEVANFEAYENCAQLDEMNCFMDNNDFKIKEKVQVAAKRNVGNYFEITYQSK